MLWTKQLNYIFAAMADRNLPDEFFASGTERKQIFAIMTYFVFDIIYTLFSLKIFNNIKNTSSFAPETLQSAMLCLKTANFSWIARRKADPTNQFSVGHTIVCPSL